MDRYYWFGEGRKDYNGEWVLYKDAEKEVNKYKKLWGRQIKGTWILFGFFLLYMFGNK